MYWHLVSKGFSTHKPQTPYRESTYLNIVWKRGVTSFSGGSGRGTWEETHCARIWRWVPGHTLWGGSWWGDGSSDFFLTNTYLVPSGESGCGVWSRNEERVKNKGLFVSRNCERLWGLMVILNFSRYRVFPRFSDNVEKIYGDDHCPGVLDYSGVYLRKLLRWSSTSSLHIKSLVVRGRGRVHRVSRTPRGNP